MIELDLSNLAKLDLVFAEAERAALAGFYPVVKKAAQNIKTNMAADASGHPRFSHLPASITYDIVPAGLRTLLVQVGPDKRKRQGPLGNIFYFGTAKTAPVGDLTGPLQREVPNLTAALMRLSRPL
jgi:hypothetical protein